MQIVSLSINRIIIHQVYRRDEEGKKVSPLQSHEYINFDQNAMAAFKSRIIDAIGEGSNAVQMEIVNQDTNDLPILVNKMIDQDLDTFSVSSFDAAKKLSDSQQSRSIPGGIVVVFSGTHGHHQKNFLGIIKAEVHSAYEKEINPTTKEISLKFVEEVLLTPSSKLYKTAGYFEKSEYDKSSSDLNEKWHVLISDYQINKAEGKAAAKYFYSDFLGFGYPQTSARTTKLFYDSTKQFISELEIPEPKKSDLINALSTYLKVDTASTISVSSFASSYFDDLDVQDSYSSFMEESGLPTIAFTKDIEHVAGKLSTRKVSFSSNVKITAPSDVFKSRITLEAIEGDADENGTPAVWTKVIIKDKIKTQE
jgi:hypothetical protein